MTRQKIEELEAMAGLAMMGLLSAKRTTPAAELAVEAFDCAEAMCAERDRRYGEKPEHYAG